MVLNVLQVHDVKDFRNSKSKTLFLFLHLKSLKSLKIQAADLFSLRSSPLFRTWSSVTADAIWWHVTTSPSKFGTSTWRIGQWRRIRCINIPILSSVTDPNWEENKVYSVQLNVHKWQHESSLILAYVYPLTDPCKMLNVFFKYI